MRVSIGCALRDATSLTYRGIALGVALGTGACGWNMVQPTDVVQVSEELPIKDRSSWQGALVDESFKLGAYQVSDVDRKWNSTQSSSFLGFEASRMKGGYSYGLVSAAGKLKGECATEEREKGQNLGGGAEFSNLIAKLGCRCSDDNGAVTLTLEGSTSEQYKGAITGPDVAYSISAITERSKGWASHDPLGYRIDAPSAPVGAVDLKMPGRVWISKTLESSAREQVACLFAGLLLYQPAKDR
jgi:hypothetical protein